jgi:Fe-S cluster biogenesis protein NfuA
MWTREAIDNAVEAARSVVRADGGDLILVDANEKRGRIDLRLDVTNVHCDQGGSCLLPGHMLEGMIANIVQQHVEGEFELRLDDPRQQ